MKQLVLDVGTCLHWFFSAPNKHGDAENARQILSYIRHDQVGLVQPPVWATTLVAELVAFGLRDAATAAEEIVGMQVRVDSSAATLRRAVELADQLNRPVLQTIYHATALQNDICLITADDVYFRRANHLGNIMRLKDWRSNPRIAEPSAHYAVHLIPLAVAARIEPADLSTEPSFGPIVASRNARMKLSSALS